jgi:hypothetical protein
MSASAEHISFGLEIILESTLTDCKYLFDEINVAIAVQLSELIVSLIILMDLMLQQWFAKAVKSLNHSSLLCLNETDANWRKIIRLQPINLMFSIESTSILNKPLIFAQSAKLDFKPKGHS